MGVASYLIPSFPSSAWERPSSKLCFAKQTARIDGPEVLPAVCARIPPKKCEHLPKNLLASVDSFRPLITECALFFKRNESFLVCVQSSWFVGEADVACIALQQHGIPCHIENEHFHMWHWLYASITGGFKVLVPREHAEDAVRVLQSANAPSTHAERRPWQCPECGWSVDSDWDVCWFCTTTRDGIRPDSPSDHVTLEAMSEDPEAEIRLAQTRAAAVVVPLALLFWMTGGSLGAVLIAAAAALVSIQLNDKKRPPFAEAPTEDALESERRAMAQPLTPAQQSRRRRLRMGNRVVERALFAAILGVAWFPPLLVLTTILLWRLDQRKTPLDLWHRYQARFAGCLCVMGLVFLMIGLACMVGVTGDAAGLMGRWG